MSTANVDGSRMTGRCHGPSRCTTYIGGVVDHCFQPSTFSHDVTDRES